MGEVAMKRQLLILLAVPILAVAGVIALHASGAGTTVSAYDIELRASRSVGAVVASVGPGTTLHFSGVSRRATGDALPPPFQVPRDYRFDTWIAFGDDGRLLTYESATTLPDGSTNDFMTLNGDTLITVDVRTGEQQQATYEGVRQIRQLADLARQTPASVQRLTHLRARAATFRGRAVYIVDYSTADGSMERDYVERGTYTELREEIISIAQGITKIDETDDGSVEVLPGDAAPPVSELRAYGAQRR